MSSLYMGSMKYSILICSLIACSCGVLNNEGMRNVDKSRTKKLFTIPNYNLTVELEDIIWEDSTVVSLISIRPDFLSASDNISADPCGKHINLSGPIRIGSHWDTCRFYPVKYDWRSERSYFLIDDFKDRKDSLVYFSYQVSINENCQGRDDIWLSGSSLQRSELVNICDSLINKSDKKYATRKWFSQWCSENPAYKGYRTSQEHCGENP